MIPGSFNYEAPKSLSEAFSLLKKYGDGAKILSGGHSLIPMMKLRFASPEVIVDINNIPGLSDIKEDSGMVKIGALVREVQAEHSPVLKKYFPIFGDATKLIADPQVRNMGTLGGNIAHADAANDHPAVMLALNATVIVAGEKGSRKIAIDEFFQGFYQTSMEQGEILTEIQIPIPPKNTGSAYYKLERKVGDYATAGVAVQLTLEGRVCKSIRIGLTNVNPVPMRAIRTEDALKGKEITPEILKNAAKLAGEDCSPSSDLRGTEEYKREMVAVLVRRMVTLALNRAIK